MKARADEALLVQALQQDIASKVQPTPREAAQKFISDNPTMFGDRKIITLDQIQFARTASFDPVKLKDAKTMAEVATVLTDANVEFRRGTSQLDTLVMPPQLVDAVQKTVAGGKTEPFMVQMLQRQEVEKQLKAALAKIQADNKGKVVYAKGYSAPPPPPAAGAPAAGAAAAPAAAAPATPAEPAPAKP
jgi:hypothetical protein